MWCVLTEDDGEPAVYGPYADPDLAKAKAADMADAFMHEATWGVDCSLDADEDGMQVVVTSTAGRADPEFTTTWQVLKLKVY